MKTIIIILSPRKKFSASMYFSKILKFFLSKDEVFIFELKTKNQYFQLEKELKSANNLIFSTPVYVDTIPATALVYLEKIENYIMNKKISLKVYALVNCGFYEGEQCELALNTFKIWSNRCGFIFNGGLGIGSGVMLSFIRTLIPLGFITFLLEIFTKIFFRFINDNFNEASVLDNFFPYIFVIQIILFFLWNIGLFSNLFKMAKQVKDGLDMSIKYTTVSFCPRFLFVILASIYWILASFIWHKGAFWRLHKEPK
ncbi:MAG: hypothetical protein ACRC6K_03615 [Fusobacteriaceae bacterium]